VSGTRTGYGSPSRVYCEIAPPRYPVSNTTPRTAVGGVRYNTTHASWRIAIRGSIVGSQPILPHSLTYQGSKVSFHRALINRIDMEPRERSQPASGSHRFIETSCAGPILHETHRRDGLIHLARESTSRRLVHETDCLHGLANGNSRWTGGSVKVHCRLNGRLRRDRHRRDIGHHQGHRPEERALNLNPVAGPHALNSQTRRRVPPTLDREVEG